MGSGTTMGTQTISNSEWVYNGAGGSYRQKLYLQWNNGDLAAAVAAVVLYLKTVLCWWWRMDVTANYELKNTNRTDSVLQTKYVLLSDLGI